MKCGKNLKNHVLDFGIEKLKNDQKRGFQTKKVKKSRISK